MLLNSLHPDNGPFESNASRSPPDCLPLAGDRCSQSSSRQAKRTDPLAASPRDRHPFQNRTAARGPRRRARSERSAIGSLPTRHRTPAGSTGGAHVVPAAIETPPRFFIGRKHHGAPCADKSLDELLNTVQRQTLRYFWEFGHPTSGLARERSNTTRHVVTTGGSGFGIMAILAGVERGWIGRQAALDRVITIVCFLGEAERHHGAFPHWMDGDSGRTIPFSQQDDGGDLVETAYLMAGLLSARQYFREPEAKECILRNLIDEI